MGQVGQVDLGGPGPVGQVGQVDLGGAGPVGQVEAPVCGHVLPHSHPGQEPLWSPQLEHPGLQPVRPSGPQSGPMSGPQALMSSSGPQVETEVVWQAVGGVAGPRWCGRPGVARAIGA